jgi:hypothetical protein
MLLKKIFWFWWRKKKIIWFRDKKNYILTLVLSKKNILNEAKNLNPPFKLNGRSLINMCRRRCTIINCFTLILFIHLLIVVVFSCNRAAASMTTIISQPWQCLYKLWHISLKHLNNESSVPRAIKILLYRDNPDTKITIHVLHDNN